MSCISRIFTLISNFFFLFFLPLHIILVAFYFCHIVSSLFIFYVELIRVTNYFCYIFFPIFSLREYGELLVSCGLIGEAIKIFEDIELWNNLIDCYWYEEINV